jgi:Putative prokaryotic signal transducing protein
VQALACQGSPNPVNWPKAVRWGRTVWSVLGLDMEELIRSNDLVLIATVDALLKGADIMHMILDEHMSTLEGSLGMLPRRVLVDSDQAPRARRLLRDADLGHELRPEPRR